MRLFRAKKLLAFLVILFVVAVIGAFLYSNQSSDMQTKSLDCEPTETMSEAGNYDVPCEVGFTTKGNISEARLNEIVSGVNGVMISDLASIDTYYVKVPAETEDKAMQQISNYEEVKSVFRNRCCAQAN